MFRSDGTLTRLVMIVVTWSEWQPEKDRSRYERFLEMFLHDSSGSASPVYMHQCYGNKVSKEGSLATISVRDDQYTFDNGAPIAQWTEQSAPYELPSKYDCRSPEVWLTGDDALRRIVSVPEAERVVEDGKSPIHQVADWGGLFRTRLFMAADSYRAVLKCGGDSNYWVLIDTRFQRMAEGTVLWQRSFSFWSDPPWCRHHRPNNIDAPKREVFQPENAYKLLDDWRNDSIAALQRHDILEDPKTMRVFGRSYLPPVFLIAVPGQHFPDGVTAQEAEHGNKPDLLSEMSNEILLTRNYESLPHALLKGGINAFRRFLPFGGIDQPRYLLIPDIWTSVRHRPDAFRWYETQEEAVGVAAGILTDLEVYAASELGGIDSRMQIRENHLRIYQGVAEQAGTIWDALARLLPDARKARFLPGAKNRGLDIVHGSIEMIHQTLLQGVADLDQLAREINGAYSHIDSTTDEVADRFNRRLDHPSIRREGEQKAALRDALYGSVDRLRRQVREASSKADRVTESYRSLLDTIGMAFDERRVREGDRLQQASVWLVVAFGVLGLSGVAQATAPLPALDIHDWWISYIRWPLWIVACVAIIAMLVMLSNPRLRGQVASREFEKRYAVIREFLKEVSTDNLDNFRQNQRLPILVGSDGTEAEYRSAWQVLDEKLSCKFAESWEIANNPRASAKSGRYTATGLRSWVEEWTLQTLMLTERPRDFSRYELPYLTSLYRICTKKSLEGWRVAEDMPNADSVVGKDELKEALPGGYKWLIANEESLVNDKPMAVYQWLNTHAPWGENQVKRKVMIDYLDAVTRGADLSDYFTADVAASFEGTTQRAEERDLVAKLIRDFHQSFDARSELKSLLVDDGKVTVETDFVGTHIREFEGIPPTSRAIRIPYSTIYNFRAIYEPRSDKSSKYQISELRISFPRERLLSELTAEQGEQTPGTCA